MNDANPTPTPDIPALSEYIISNYYNTVDDAQALRDIVNDPDIGYDTLADVISMDIRDLLHNGNVDELFDTEHLTEDEVDALATRFHDDFDQLDELSEFLATLINTHYPI